MMNSKDNVTISFMQDGKKREYHLCEELKNDFLNNVPITITNKHDYDGNIGFTAMALDSYGFKLGVAQNSYKKSIIDE